MSRLHLHRAGRRRPGVPVLILLHGWSCHGGFFAPQLEELGGLTEVIAPDLPGHGKTADAVTPSIEAGADALAAMMQQEGIAEAVLVGWSMGALVAWSMIERHGSDRLSTLVVEDMAPRVINGPDWTLGTLNGLDGPRNAVFLKAIESQWPLLAPATARRSFALDARKELVEFAEREMRKASPPLLAAMWRSLTTQDFRPLTPRIDVPVVLARGARSQLYSLAAAEWQAAHLPRARIETFAQSGHSPHLEEASRFNDMLVGLIERRGRAQGAANA
ncbi:alpha/beta fold hydrolase [Stappia indica]|uniref:Pimeloyl-[acyl-carrier protein] methyl ester esterase n=1 Tax=Stappia indica TaxID=538381 RepID=A0A285T9B6_9HYPH|nr:alpha/beta hydrolase [Stappia indica]SOC17998.1 pimeloyl-[acyl-carrier protein] methyl ester esterase [Stappia indica]